MLAHKIVLRQRYSLSFFTTTLLIALTTQSSLAFSIKPLGPSGAVESWIPNESYVLENLNLKGITNLNQSSVKSLTRGGTQGFLDTLRMKFPLWIFEPATNDLAGSFNVLTYEAVGTPTGVGANLLLTYTPDGNDPTPHDNSLHWIQRVENDHNAKGNHGDKADIIDNDDGKIDPFYDTVGTANESGFLDTPRRPDAFNNHDWVAELYLVEETEPKKVTIYNGIKWGWENRVVPRLDNPFDPIDPVEVPEPLTIFGSGMGLGLGFLFKKYSTKQKKAKNLEKLKS